MTPEEQARASVDCSRCKATAGNPCVDSNGNAMPSYEGGPLVHPARLHAWQATQ